MVVLQWQRGRCLDCCWLLGERRGCGRTSHWKLNTRPVEAHVTSVHNLWPRTSLVAPTVSPMHRETSGSLRQMARGPHTAGRPLVSGLLSALLCEASAPVSGFLLSAPWALCSVLAGGSHGPAPGRGSSAAFQREHIFNSTTYVSTHWGRTDPELSAEGGRVPTRLLRLEFQVTATVQEGLEVVNDYRD